MLVHDADDQLALDHDADDQLALDHDADDQLALDHDADDQLALDQEAAFQSGLAGASADQPAESNVFSPVAGSTTTNPLSPAFGLALPSAARAPAMFTVPTPSAPVDGYPVGTFADTIRAPLT